MEVNDALSQYQIADEQRLLTEQQINVLDDAVKKTELLMKYSNNTYLEVLTA